MYDTYVNATNLLVKYLGLTMKFLLETYTCHICTVHTEKSFTKSFSKTVLVKITKTFGMSNYIANH